MPPPAPAAARAPAPLSPGDKAVLRLQLLGSKRLPVQVIYQATGVFPFGRRGAGIGGGLVVDWSRVDSQDPALIKEVRRRFDARKAGLIPGARPAAAAGNEDLPWPDEVRAEMDRLDADIDRLLKDIENDKRPELDTAKDTYKNWVNDWRKWEAENRNSWMMFISAASVRAKVREWQKNQDSFRAYFLARGVVLAPPVVQPPPKPPSPSPVLSTLDNISYALIIAALVGGGIYIAKTVKG